MKIHPEPKRENTEETLGTIARAVCWFGVKDIIISGSVGCCTVLHFTVGSLAQGL
jgi:hypothetical protein